MVLLIIIIVVSLIRDQLYIQYRTRCAQKSWLAEIRDWVKQKLGTVTWNEYVDQSFCAHYVQEYEIILVTVGLITFISVFKYLNIKLVSFII